MAGRADPFVVGYRHCGRGPFDGCQSKGFVCAAFLGFADGGGGSADISSPVSLLGSVHPIPANAARNEASVYALPIDASDRTHQNVDVQCVESRAVN